MLTSAQVATAAYMTADGELYRDMEDVPEDEQGFRVPFRDVSQYELDEMASERAYDYEWDVDIIDDHVARQEREKHEECVPALYDELGNELVEEYHYHPERGVRA